jgi:hypothetical protein
VDRPQGTPLEGQLIVTADTMIVVAKSATCHPATVQPSGTLMLVRCDNVALTIDRFGTHPNVTATVDVLTPGTRRVCVAFADGGARCVRFQTIATSGELQTVTARVVVTRGVPKA